MPRRGREVEKWLVVAKVKFVLIAPPGWKFQFSPRFVKLFIRRFNESSRRDTTENSSSDDHDDLHDESFPLEPFVDKGSRMRAGGQKVRGG